MNPTLATIGELSEKDARTVLYNYTLTVSLKSTECFMKVFSYSSGKLVQRSSGFIVSFKQLITAVL